MTHDTLFRQKEQPTPKQIFIHELEEIEAMETKVEEEPLKDIPRDFTHYTRDTELWDKPPNPNKAQHDFTRHT